MKYIIIDIGSNTIKMDVFSVLNANSICLDKQEYVTAGLINYIENNQMNQDGIDKLCTILDQFIRRTDDLENAQLFCFATASLRRAANAQSIIQEVFIKTNLKIQLLSEEEEALLSMKAVQHEVGSHKSGIMLDMGGGSTEKVLFNGDTILSARSMPFGSLSLYRQFVTGSLPTPDEAKRLAAYVLDQFQDSSSAKQETLYIVGGTGRAFCTLHGQLYEKNSQALYSIHTSELIAFIHQLLLSDHTERQLEEIIPERKYTFMPGLIALGAMAKRIGAMQVLFPLGNVRQGYLLSIL
ncbi:MAG: hypothetical protein HFE78_04835 [Clostridiales bacterium]|nr:hypothetical protein [Clostridiales bacterium]